MLRSRFVDPARLELAEAVRWYRTEAGAERATDFRFAVKRVVARAVRFPLSARVIDRVASLELRGFVVAGYPYVVVAAPVGGELVIYAVAHQSREPSYWKPRLASVRP
jgi:plasmid stabilization system protein ParE